jgi:hypothetical protein
MAIAWILADSLSRLYSNMPIPRPFLMPSALHFYAIPHAGTAICSRSGPDLLAPSPFFVVILSLIILEARRDRGSSSRSYAILTR